MVPLGHRDPSVSKGRLADREPLEPKVQLVSKVLLVNLEHLVKWVQEGRMAARDPKEKQVPPVCRERQV